MTDPQSDFAAYTQVADDLRSQIESGKIPPGGKLPSENELIRLYKVSRVTARGAIKILQHEGRVHTRQGKGTFAKDRMPKRVLSAERYRVNARHAAGLVAESVAPFSEPPDTTGEHRTVEARYRETRPPDRVADVLGLTAGERVLERYLVYLVEGKPDRIITSYIPADLVRGTPVADEANEPWPGGIVGLLTAVGAPASRAAETVLTRMPTPEEVQQLRLLPGVPLLVVSRTMFTGTGDDRRPIEVAPSILMAGDRVRLEFNTEIDIVSG